MYIWSHQRCSHCIWKNQKYQDYVRSFQTLRKVWYVWTSFHLYRNHWIHGNNYFTLCTYGRIRDAIGVYEKIKKIPMPCITLFKSWEKYGIYEHHFISIENIVSYGIIILLSLHIIAPSVLSLHMKKSKNTNAMYNPFQKLRKIGIFERYFISIENIGSMGIIILPCVHMVAPVP